MTATGILENMGGYAYENSSFSFGVKAEKKPATRKVRLARKLPTPELVFQ